MRRMCCKSLMAVRSPTDHTQCAEKTHRVIDRFVGYQVGRSVRPDSLGRTQWQGFRAGPFLRTTASMGAERSIARPCQPSRTKGTSARAVPQPRSAIVPRFIPSASACGCPGFLAKLFAEDLFLEIEQRVESMVIVVVVGNGCRIAYSPKHHAARRAEVANRELPCGGSR